MRREAAGSGGRKKFKIYIFYITLLVTRQTDYSDKIHSSWEYFSQILATFDDISKWSAPKML